MLQGVVDAVNAVFFHGKQKARRHLRLGSGGIEERGGGMGEPLFRQQVVGFDYRINIIHVDAHGHAHQHVLRTLHHLAVQLHQVGALQGAETEVVVAEVAVVDDGGVEQGSMFLDYRVGFLGDQGGIFTGFGVYVGVEPLHGIGKRLAGGFVQVADGNAGRQPGVVGVGSGKRSGCFGRQVVQLNGGNTIVNTGNHLFGNIYRIYIAGVEAVAEFLDAGGNLVKFYRFASSVSFYN